MKFNMDDMTVEMSQCEFDVLDEYSASIPTNPSIGRIWKKGHPYMKPRKSYYVGMCVHHSTVEEDTVYYKKGQKLDEFEWWLVTKITGVRAATCP